MLLLLEFLSLINPQSNCTPILCPIIDPIIVTFGKGQNVMSRLLNIKTTALNMVTAIFATIFLFINLCSPKFSYIQNPENVQPHSSNSIETA